MEPRVTTTGYIMCLVVQRLQRYREYEAVFMAGSSEKKQKIATLLEKNT